MCGGCVERVARGSGGLLEKGTITMFKSPSTSTLTGIVWSDMPQT